MINREERSKLIASKIKELREEEDWSQSELARQAGVSPAAINQIEQGKRIPSLIVSRKIATALKVTVAEVTGESEESSSSIDREAKSFFRNFGSISELSEEDQGMVKGLVERLKKTKDGNS